jgi:hypothetical protein
MLVLTININNPYRKYISSGLGTCNSIHDYVNESNIGRARMIPVFLTEIKSNVVKNNNLSEILISFRKLGK